MGIVGLLQVAFQDFGGFGQHGALGSVQNEVNHFVEPPCLLIDFKSGAIMGFNTFIAVHIVYVAESAADLVVLFNWDGVCQFGKFFSKFT